MDTPSYYDLHKSCGVGVVPFVTLIYYDDFRKNRLLPGQIGGLYFALLNFKRCHARKIINLFQIALVQSDNDYIRCMQLLADEFKVLQQTMRIYLAGTDKVIHCQTFLGVSLADMPQRNQNCSMLAQNSTNGICCTCNGNEHEHLNVSFNPQKSRLSTGAYSANQWPNEIILQGVLIPGKWKQEVQVLL